MGKQIRIPLNDAQKKKIHEKLGRVCDVIEVDADDLIDMVRYISPQICIDFDEEQEKIVKKAFPGHECDFAIIDRTELVNMLKYMPPTT